MELEIARKMGDGALQKARALNLKPMSVFIQDARGAIRLVLTEDGASQQRAEIAYGKSNGAIAFGMGTRGLAKRVGMVPEFMSTVVHAIRGPLVPVAGGVLVKDKDGTVIGAIGISGDTADHDEACAVSGIEAVGLVAQIGD
ncbi:MAG: heme-binding protein [Rhodospirillales bacterium]|jgi:uncharacterized protein GlcG (DUF336 family)|nr:heme-binding protein [Rhodospirillales bacterium]MBT4007328.1 heme-binding protein [Rhodospirillales bacterium]MBT5076968.1 heme-binding protein [Rhodospirillales bacterium]MBT5113661.1 heme-binding protein [Rhodospirillales bacterium]MBT5673959.1 heme-binding protein [Rhodospirillales bacterium]